MFRKKSIDEWSLKYWLLQQYNNFSFRIYYRKLQSVNRSNIPRNEPVILAPNHQNALMDALAVVSDAGLQPVFLARADIFKGKIVCGILHFLNIMPIFRIRDGIQNVRRNDMVFEKSLRVIHNRHNPLSIFPEGNHGDKRRLRQLVKGIFRIALLAQEKYGEKPAVKILPIGLDYGHYQKFRSTLFINYGKPIEVSEFYLFWKNNPVDAINRLRSRLAEELKKLMIHIGTEEYYDLYMKLREVFNSTMREKMGIEDDSLASRFMADKKMIDILDQTLERNPGEIAALNQLMSDYQDLLKKYNFRDWMIAKGRFSLIALLAGSLLLLLLFPVFIYGYLTNILPFSIPVRIARTKVKDPQFHSTFKFVLGLILFPVTYLLLLIPGFLLIENPWMRLAYLISLPLAGMFAFSWYIHFKKIRSGFRFFRMKLSGNPAIKKLLGLRKTMIDRMNLIIQPVIHEYQR
ncbi:MAG: 1-acyl-sn-glycerol-3-phosphate acyltransferase [Bacteroidales bacterium]|nr:1-acyl-sn-glycerol-3-phosphate acyltransferase [Bacteroidales bacterium]